MWRRLSVLSTAMPLIGLTVMADAVHAAEPAPELVQQHGEILDQPPPHGRCPGVSRTSYAASTGLQWLAPLWERQDRLGVGYSFQREVAGEEHLAEAYYNMFLTDHLSVIGNVEWLISGPNQVTGKTNHHVVIPGVRAVVGF